MSKPDGLAVVIRQWITEHPGRYRPNEVADALPPRLPDPAMWRQRVSNEMARMYRSGVLARGRTTNNTMGIGVLYWLAKDAPPLEQHVVAVSQVTCSCELVFPDMTAAKAHQEKARNPKARKRVSRRG